MRYERSLSKWLTIASGAVGGLVIFCMTLFITVDVLGRYLFGKPILVAVEMSGYMLVALIFLGLAYTEGKDRHIAISFVTDRLSRKIRKLLETANLIVAVIFVGWLVWLTVQPVITDYVIGTTSQSGTYTPMWMPELLIPVGLGLFIIQLIVRLASNLKSYESDDRSQGN